MDDKGSTWKANIDKAPGFVRFTLLGIPTRAMALFFVVASVVAAIASFLWLETWIALLFVFAAIAYFYSMTWVDKNG